ncbi:MAG TPA: acetoacetate decarboxylase family protein [Enhygromyxa sp.]|nr:acetoacetate decarboxylase family protein [Enhygromyxa sp.]
MTIPYVTRDDEQTFAPPYVQAGCALHGFALPAERARLQALVDRYLVLPSEGRVPAVVEADAVLLYFCDFARSHSADVIDARRGWLGERECGVWVPIRRPGVRTPSFFVHTMIVDSGPAMCSGREVLGFPKQIGSIEVARDPERASTLAADTLVCGDGRADAGRWRPLVELERVEPAGDERGERLGALFEALGLALAQGRELLGGGALAAARGELEFVNLKQFRDAADPRLACYRAIVRSRARLLGVQRVAATPSYAYRLSPRASERLGVPESGRTRGLFCEFDFELGLGEVLS